ncbi:hypothetical protein N7523_007499 [Penicillium sp. IBT 18751x]|nr:hypothetical protein N7523_007499 [Penicillium sp. IBT 18751x]
MWRKSEVHVFEVSKGLVIWSRFDNKTITFWNPSIGQSISTLIIRLTSSLKSDTADIGCLHTTTDKQKDTLLRPVPHQQHGYALRDDRSLTTYKGLNIFWLHSKYRSTRTPHFAVHVTIMAVTAFSKQFPVASVFPLPAFDL